MKMEDKKIIKDMMKHRRLEQNLPAYATKYINTAYEYSLIHLVLSYYTMREVIEENGTREEYSVLDKLHTLIFQTLLQEEQQVDEEAMNQLQAIRQDMTKRMLVLTAYTDALQICEYVFNRIEYGITEETFPVDTQELSDKVLRYLFREDDKMVVNSKIQMVTGQLPIRMTKNRFFDYLTATLNIYNGSDQSAVDGFVTLLKSSALLELPEGYEETCPEIRQVIRLMEEADLKRLDLPAYSGLMEQFSVTTNRLTEMVSDHLLIMEIINSLYAVLLALPYETEGAAGGKTCLSMLKGLHDSFLSDSDIPEMVNEGFEQIEGLQEHLGEDLLRYTSVLQDVREQYKEPIRDLQLNPVYESLLRISKLLSSSLFIDLDQEETGMQTADAAYIAKKRDELVHLLTDFFDQHSREVNRAVMAAMFSNMPVLFNSRQEVQDYIIYSLEHCSNTSELMACARLLEEMMEVQ